MQAERIIEIEASVDSQTVLTKATDFAASTLTMGGANKDLKEIRQCISNLQLISPLRMQNWQPSTPKKIVAATGKTETRRKHGQACTCQQTARGIYTTNRETARKWRPISPNTTLGGIASWNRMRRGVTVVM